MLKNFGKLLSFISTETRVLNFQEKLVYEIKQNNASCLLAFCKNTKQWQIINPYSPKIECIYKDKRNKIDLEKI